jgi:hypothetical protein
MPGEAGVPRGDGVALGSGDGDAEGVNVPPTVGAEELGVGVVAAGVAHAVSAISSAKRSGPRLGWRIGQFG